MAAYPNGYKDADLKSVVSSGMGVRITPLSFWGISSTGRAPALQAGGYGFESRIFHLSVMMRITYYGISFICEDADYYWTDSSSIMERSLNSD